VTDGTEMCELSLFPAAGRIEPMQHVFELAVYFSLSLTVTGVNNEHRSLTT